MELVNEPHPLGSLLAYQSGAVVSKTLLKQDTGTVTLFAFDRGEGLSEHTAPFDALVVMVEGTADITVAGETHRCVAGDLLRLPARQPHQVFAAERFQMLLIMIRS
ncbi:MAG: cupin domain-containing protein [Candidatus Neomarinimicrobiota bacterium]|nr:MAG: cupin domain-containing protein [Candidatus Neomarinimicrobiota bacterium]